jgi:hypothetical protein
MHATPLQIGILAVVYAAFTTFDHWRSNQKIRKPINALDNERYGWKADSGDPTQECMGNLTRIRLPKTEQIVVNRVGELLHEMERARLYDIP